MLKDFKAFLMRGNVVDLAVALILGAAFKAVVDSLVANVLSPIVGLVAGKDFGALTITLKHATATNPPVVLGYGQLINAVVAFVLVAAAIFFFVVKPLNALAERRKRGGEPIDDTPAPSDEAILLTEIRDLLRQRA